MFLKSALQMVGTVRDVKMRWSTEIKTLVGFAAALLLIALVGWVAYLNASNYIETNALVVHTHEVLQEVEDVFSTSLDAETSQRGYLITGDESYLDLYTNARSTIDQHLLRLQSLTADNPQQQDRIDTLSALISERFDSLERTLQLYMEEGFESAQQTIESGAGKLLMDQIRNLISEMIEEESRLLSARSAESTERAQSTLLIALLLTGCLFGLLSFIYLIIRRDIVGRKRVEAALEMERTLLRTVLDTIPDFIYFKDVEGVFVLTNASHSRMMGASSPEAVIGKTDFDWFPKELAARYTADERELVRTGKPLVNQEEPTVDHEGNPLTVLTTKIPLRNSQGEVSGIVGITRDITERKRQEREIKQLNNDLYKQTRQLEVANKELEAFTYSVSHDLRAPLRAIDGFSRILMNSYSEQLPPDALRYLQRVRDNAQKMGTLIDDLLAFSRLSRQPIKLQTVALDELVREVVEVDLLSERENRQIEIVFGNLPTCQADPALLRQVLINLIGNALKYSHSREQARIEIGSQQENGRDVVFVKDNGIGFDMQYVNKLFGVFQRLHQDEQYEGTGVGLALVQRIIARHGGRVWAEGAVDQGATFYFALGGEKSE